MLLVLLTNSRDLQRVELINDIESPNLEWKDAAADLKKWGEKMIASLVSKRERLNQLGFQIFGRNWLLLVNKPGLSRTNTELSYNPRQDKTVVSFAPHGLNSRRADTPIRRDDIQQLAHALDVGVIAI